MNHAIHNSIVSFIWGIADDVLRDVYVRGKYRDVILPMTVIRRLDAVLESKKEAVLAIKKQLDKLEIMEQEATLCHAAGEAFYNVSSFTLKSLKNNTDKSKLQQDFLAYLDGFSNEVQEILDKFKFRNQIQTLIDANILDLLIEKFTNPNINLSPKPVLDDAGNELLPALDNHAMGTIFEELIRRFNEENNEEAGEHFTPRDVVNLMADLLFLPVLEQIKSGTYCVYDGCCGTGGMLTVAEERLQQLAAKHDKKLSIHLFGQEVQPETYAIAKADLLLKGEGSNAKNIRYGSTLASDAFPADEFDFMLSNPPYGKSWTSDLERLGGKDELQDPRFVTQHAGEQDYRMVTRSSDGQLMFLVNKLSKMKEKTALGSRIAVVHNGSALFTGDAGQGESQIRRWIIDNDWLEAIIALPENMFYNTGIATYIWLLSNRKTAARRGKVQLIDASSWFVPLRRNLGKKNCEFSEAQITAITDLVLNPRETAHCKILPNEALGYWKITVERPLRLAVDWSAAALERLATYCGKEDQALVHVVERVAAHFGGERGLDFNVFLAACEADAKKHGAKLTAKRMKCLRLALCERCDEAAAVIKKVHKKGVVDALHGRFPDEGGAVEYEPDTSLRDSEQIPLLEEGGIEGFFRRTVLPYAPDAWIDAEKTQVGYEISLTRYFYKPQPLRDLSEIAAELRALEQESEGLLAQLLGD